MRKIESASIFTFLETVPATLFRLGVIETAFFNLIREVDFLPSESFR
jgi:hypothetical protein